MKSNPSLSFVLTTYNKLPYLKSVLDHLLLNKKVDEEIIVTDGGSSDGTKEYLELLYKENKISEFVSEKDQGEADGFNKAVLLSKGTLIKIITDDDVFNYSAINQCREYMFQNPDIDVVTGNILSVNTTISPAVIEYRKNYETWFREWTRKDAENCFFSGLPLMIRKSSFANLGLFDISFKHLDLEFSVRITSKRAKIAYYTGIVAAGIVNESSISKNYTHLLNETRERLFDLYGFIDKRGVRFEKSSSLRRKVIDRIAPLRQQFNKRKWLMPVVEHYPDYDIKTPVEEDLYANDFPAVYNYLLKYLEKNPVHTPEFIVDGKE